MNWSLKCGYRKIVTRIRNHVLVHITFQGIFFYAGISTESQPRARPHRLQSQMFVPESIGEQTPFLPVSLRYATFTIPSFIKLETSATLFVFQTHESSKADIASDVLVPSSPSGQCQNLWNRATRAMPPPSRYPAYLTKFGPLPC